jgi:hypothetical protein
MYFFTDLIENGCLAEVVRLKAVGVVANAAEAAVSPLLHSPFVQRHPGHKVGHLTVK